MSVPFDPNVTQLLIWGSSGHAKVLAEIAALAGVEIVALFDRDPDAESAIDGVALQHSDEELAHVAEAFPNTGLVGAIAAIGGARGQDRRHYLDRFRQLGFATPSAIHPSAWVSPSATIHANCHVLAHAVVGVEAVLGEACIVNTSASVDHECRLADGVHIGPGARLAGCVAVGEDSFVGASATILPRVSIGRGVTVGAGAVVTQDVPDGATVVGCPARALPRKAQEPK